jgi:hypothetical protein
VPVKVTWAAAFPTSSNENTVRKSISNGVCSSGILVSICALEEYAAVACCQPPVEVSSRIPESMKAIKDRGRLRLYS